MDDVGRCCAAVPVLFVGVPEEVDYSFYGKKLLQGVCVDMRAPWGRRGRGVYSEVFPDVGGGDREMNASLL